MEVVKPFIDKISKRIYNPGDQYIGTSEREKELVSKGLIGEKQIVEPQKPEKQNVVFSQSLGKGNKNRNNKRHR